MSPTIAPTVATGTSSHSDGVPVESDSAARATTTVSLGTTTVNASATTSANTPRYSHGPAASSHDVTTSTARLYRIRVNGRGAADRSFWFRHAATARITHVVLRVP